MTKCPTPEKVRYSVVTKARTAAAHLRRTHGRLCEPYRCACGAWHLSKRLTAETMYTLVWQSRGLPDGPLLEPLSGEVVGRDEGDYRVLDRAWLEFHGYTAAWRRKELVQSDERFVFGADGKVRCVKPDALDAHLERVREAERQQLEVRRLKRQRQRHRRSARRAALREAA